MQHQLWEKLKQQTFHAHIADIDGNLTPTNIKATTELSPKVIEIIVNKVNNDIPFGIATARSMRSGGLLENIKNAVVKKAKAEKIKNFFLFPNQGMEAISFEGDKENKIDLVKHFNIAKKQPTPDVFQTIFSTLKQELRDENIFYKSDKLYGFQITTSDNDTISDLASSINKILQRIYPEYEALTTRTSIFVAIKGANKELPLKYISKLYNIPFEKIITTDDQGSEIGIGYHLIKHLGGITTNHHNANCNNQLNLPAICGKTGLDAWLFLNDNIKYSSP